MNKNSLEQKILFRLIKVVYIFSLLVGFFAVGVVGWLEKPQRYKDNEKSYITCDNNDKYLLSKVGIYIYDDVLTGDYDKKAKMACGYWSEEKLQQKIEQARAMEIPDDAIEQQIRTSIVTGKYGVASGKFGQLSPPNYKVTFIDSVRGSWLIVLLWWTIGFLMVYVVLNLIRETMNYILFGRSFQWKRIIKVV